MGKSRSFAIVLVSSMFSSSLRTPSCWEQSSLGEECSLPKCCSHSDSFIGGGVSLVDVSGRVLKTFQKLCESTLQFVNSFSFSFLYCSCFFLEKLFILI